MARHHPNGQQVPTREVGGDQEHFRAQDQLMARTGHATELCSCVLFDCVEEDVTARFFKPLRLTRGRILSSHFMGREPRPPAMRSSLNPFHLAVTFSGSPSPSQRAVIDRKVQVSHLHRLWKPDDAPIIGELTTRVNRWRPVGSWPADGVSW